MPADFLDVVEHRLYLDQVHERLATLDVPPPPRYVQHTPVLFAEWVDWAQDQMKKPSAVPTAEIQSFGDPPRPEWMHWEFPDLETFYQHYEDVTA